MNDIKSAPMTPEERAEKIEHEFDTYVAWEGYVAYKGLKEKIVAEIRAAIAEEREACADLATAQHSQRIDRWLENFYDGWNGAVKTIADAIRARGAERGDAQSPQNIAVPGTAHSVPTESDAAPRPEQRAGGAPSADRDEGRAALVAEWRRLLKGTTRAPWMVDDTGSLNILSIRVDAGEDATGDEVCQTYTDANKPTARQRADTALIVWLRNHAEDIFAALAPTEPPR